MRKKIIIPISITLSFLLFSQEDGIYPYKDSHKAHIKPIALADMARLASTFDFSEESYLRSWEYQVETALGDDEIMSNVYVKKDKPVGFINYKLYRPYASYLFSDKQFFNATIHHLAVDEKARGNGYGAKLVAHAIADCRKRSVGTLSLWAHADPRLERFYRRCGFQTGRTTKCVETYFSMKLKPHRLFHLVRSLFRK